MNILITEFTINTIKYAEDNFVVLYDSTQITEEKINNLIQTYADELYYYNLPSHPNCVFMTVETYNNVFKSLKGRIKNES